MYVICGDHFDGWGPFYTHGKSLKLTFSAGYLSGANTTDHVSFDVYKQTRRSFDGYDSHHSLILF